VIFGVEEFLTKFGEAEEIRTEFANTHCAAEAKRFLPYPHLTSPKQKLRERDQTNNASKQIELLRDALSFRWLVCL